MIDIPSFAISDHDDSKLETFHETATYVNAIKTKAKYNFNLTGFTANDVFSNTTRNLSPKIQYIATLLIIKHVDPITLSILYVLRLFHSFCVCFF